jgi:subtilisin family serine protease
MFSRTAKRGRPRVSFLAGLLAVLSAVLFPSMPASANWVRDAEWWLESYGFTEAWNVTQGEGVLVAVIDSGIADVPDLAGAVVGGADFSGVGSADGRTPVGVQLNHGTMVASVLAGRGTGNGILGAAPQAQLLSASIGFGGVSEISPDDQVASAVRWAVDMGAKVINMSITRNTLDWPPSWDDAMLYAFENDVVVVAASGNRANGTDEVGAPATMPGVLGVGGFDRDGNASWDASTQGITIGVAGPSEDLIGINRFGDPQTWSGSSGAAPIVSGLVALVRAAYPELDAANVIQRVLATATPVGTVPSPLYGYGRINAAAAVSADVAPVATNPMGSLEEWVRLNRRAAPTDSPTAYPTATPAALPLGRLMWPAWGFFAQRYGVPIMFALVFGSLIALGIAAVTRRARRRRRESRS